MPLGAFALVSMLHLRKDCAAKKLLQIGSKTIRLYEDLLGNRNIEGLDPKVECCTIYQSPSVEKVPSSLLPAIAGPCGIARDV